MSEIKRMLEQVADDAPSFDVVPVDRLQERIRRRRLAASAAVATTVALVAAVGIILAVQWGVSPESPAQRPVDAGCAERMGIMPATDSPLTMTAAPPNGNTITITITNTSRADVAGTTAVHPDLTVTDSDGKVVAMPAPIRDAGVEVNLAPGASRIFETPLDPQRCGRVEPGVYQAHGAMRFDLRDGTTVQVRGGPWAITIQ